MDERQVVLGFLLPANEQLAEAVVPRSCALDHPAPRRVATPGSGVEGLFASAPDVGLVAALTHPGLDLGVVVALVKAQMLTVVRSRLGTRHDDIVHSRQAGFHVVDVGRRQRDAHRGAA